MKIVFLFVTLLFGISVTEGIRCWSCENMRSNEACKMFGHLEQCLVNQFHCQNEVRAIAGGKYFEITKRCKQDFGCVNNKKQNFTGSVPFQCATEEPHSVCRCCCGFDNCNGPEVNCLLGPPVCDPGPDAPINGRVMCGRRVHVGATCYYECNKGYKLVGERFTMCELLVDGTTTWTNPPPICEEAKCFPPQEDPENGVVSCTNGENIGSDCTFTCNEPYFRIGPEVVTCTEWGLWSDLPPVCIDVPCKKPMPNDPHRTETCTDEYNIDSECSYVCDAAYDLVGEETLLCGLPIVNKRGQWDYPAPTCKLGSCDIDLTGESKCTNGAFVGSVCVYSCKPGEYMRDPDGNVVTSYERECEEDRTWTGSAPTCHPITCEPPSSNPEHGSVDCSNRNNFNSVCKYECEREYDRVGSEDRQCVADNNKDEFGVWNRPEPTCTIGKCPPFITTVSIVCTAGNNVGSVCTLQCKPGQFMRNSDGTLVELPTLEVECQDDRTWSDGPPTCHDMTCEPPASAPGNGTVACSNRNLIGSECSYRCREGFKLVGDADRDCEDDGDLDETGAWSPPAEPTCIPDTCKNFEIPGVTKTCSNGNVVGSTCVLECDDKDSELIGNGRVVCKMPPGGGEPDWDPAVNARCEKMRCPPFPEPGQGPAERAGSLVCSNLDRNPPIGTECDLTCNLGFQAKDKVVKSTCVQKDTWDFPEICCVECLINPALDVVVLLDSSENVEGIDIWQLKTDFVVDFAKFLVGQAFSLNITIIPFAANVDLANSIDFTPIDENNPAERLRAELNSLPYAGRGASNSGKALKYAEEDIFDGYSEFRVPMVFLVTAKAPSDRALALSTSRKMQDRLLHLRIIPLIDDKVADAGANQNVFEQMTESPDFVVYAPIEDSPDDFLDTASLDLVTVTSYLCNSQEQHTANCIFEDDFFFK